MINPYSLMASNKPNVEVQSALTGITPEQLKDWADDVNDTTLPYVLSYVSEMIVSCNVQDVVITGGLLEAASQLLEPEHRRELYDNLLEDIGICRSQSFRNRAVWRCFATPLQVEPKLKKRFCRESLKILAEERTPQGARDEAMQLAREGHKITIKQAQALQAKHGVAPQPEPMAEAPVTVPTATPSKPSSRKSGKWLFVGSAARIEVVPTSTPGITDVEAIIRDLEAAISQLRSTVTTDQAA